MVTLIEVELLAGPDLDAAVAEKVMGWTRLREHVPGIRWYRDAKGAEWRIPFDEGGRELALKADAGRDNRIWSPSTDIAAAWEVFNLWPDEYRFICWRSGKWEVHLTRLIAGQRHGNFNSSVVADTAPLAICRAALTASPA